MILLNNNPTSVLISTIPKYIIYSLKIDLLKAVLKYWIIGKVGNEKLNGLKPISFIINEKYADCK